MFRESDKKALRIQMKSIRDGIPAEKRADWSLKICRHIENLCSSRRLKRIGAFWPFKSEVDLRALAASRTDWIFVFPRVISTHPPRLAWGPEPLEKGLFGLMEPVMAQHFMPPVQILLVPGMAFDNSGYRIGYGGGFYDALLERLSCEVITLGAAFSLQMTPRLPVGPIDQPVQGIVTEEGIHWMPDANSQSTTRNARL